MKRANGIKTINPLRDYSHIRPPVVSIFSTHLRTPISSIIYPAKHDGGMKEPRLRVSRSSHSSRPVRTWSSVLACIPYVYNIENKRFSAILYSEMRFSIMITGNPLL